MKTFITCNLNDNFVQRLVDLIEAEYINQGLDMSGLSLVFGGKRPALFVKKELSRRIKKSFIPPRFFSMDEFMRFAVERSGGFSLINDLEAGFIIYNLVKAHAPEILEKRASFAEFLPWAREIVSFFEQLDLEDVQSTVLDNIRLNAEIGYDVPDSVNFLLTRLIFLRENFHRILIEKKQYSRGLMYMLASRSVDGSVLEGMGRILFCNFFYLHKTERELINKLCKAGISSLFVQGGEEWPVLNELARDFGFSFDSGKKNEPSYGLSVTRGFDIHSQVCVIRDIIKGIKNPDKTVIVMPDSNSLIPLLSEVSSFVPDFNVSMGYPLKRSVFYSLFDFIFKAQSTKKGDAYYAKDYLNLLSHPLIKNIRFENYPPSVTRILVHKIEEIIVGIEATPLSGSLFVSLEEIENLHDLYDLSLATMKHMDEHVNREDIRKMVVRLHELLFFSWEKVECFSDFASRVDGVIQILIDKGFISGYPLHVKIIEKIRECSEALRNSSFSGEHFSREDLFKIFRNKLDSEMISFSGSPLKGMQILGLLETRALNFENVVIMDANETVLPSLKINEPLIPREVMLRLGINHLEKEEEIQRYQIMRLISAAKNVFFVYAENNRKERSRFVEELIWESQKKQKTLYVLDVPKALFRVEVSPRHKEVRKSPEIAGFLKSLSFSASSINMYLHCPLQFYYRYVLGLREKEALIDEPEGADIGTFIHELLEEVFGSFKGKRPVIDKDFEKYFFGLLDEKFSRDFERKMKSDAFLLKEILIYRMRRFLQNERARPVAAILGLEKKFNERAEFGLSSCNLVAKVDRIDRLDDNSILVLDYKTGFAEMPGKADVFDYAGFSREYIRDTVKSFQLPIYLYFVDRKFPGEKTNACLYAIRDLEKNMGLIPFFKKEEQYARKEEIMNGYYKALEFILSEIMDSDVPFSADTHDVRVCEYCPFSGACAS